MSLSAEVLELIVLLDFTRLNGLLVGLGLLRPWPTGLGREVVGNWEPLRGLLSGGGFTSVLNGNGA
jgi:hypothetical protein